MMAGNEPYSGFIWVPGQAEEKQALTQGLGAETCSPVYHEYDTNLFQRDAAHGTSSSP